MRVAVIPPMAGMLRIPSAVRSILVAAAWIAMTGQSFAQAPPCLPSSPAPGPCILDSSFSVASFTEWDLGDRALVLATGRTITVQTFGSFSVHAAQITLAANAKINAKGTGGAGGTVSLDGLNGVTLEAGSQIDVAANSFGGIVSLGSDLGAVVMNGALKAHGNGGGFAIIFGETGVTIGGAGIDCSGGVDGGGSIEAISSGDIVVSGKLNVDGEGFGGDINLDAGGSIATQGDGLIDLRGRGDAGSGGVVLLTAGGSATVGAGIDGYGSSGEFGDGDGGEVEVSGEDGDVALNAKIDLRGGGNDGYGGVLTVDAGGAAQITGQVLAVGKANGQGLGGEIDISAGTTLGLAGSIDARGGVVGGFIIASAGGAATVTGSLLASGTPAPAADGGVIVVTACSISVPQGGVITNLGAGDPLRGINRLQASSTMTIGGTISAGIDNFLEWLTVPPGFLPTQTITPAPQQPQNLALECCTESCPSSTTTSTTSTTVVTTTTTTSTIPETTTTTTVDPTTTTTTTTLDTSTTTTTLDTTTTTVDSTTLPPSTSTSTTTTTTTAPPTTTTTTLPPECIDQPLVGYDAVDCRLDTIDEVLAGETVDTLGGKRLAKRIANAVTKARTAMTTARTGRKVVPNLRRANKQLRVFQKSVTSAQKKGLPADVGASLMSLATGATSEIGVLRATQQ
jgi:hypothetical protein